MTRAAESKPFDFERREPRCRICRDETLLVWVNDLLDWRGVPVLGKSGKWRTISLSDIFRHLDALNEHRAKGDRITYSSLWVHARRHYDRAAVAAYRFARLKKELMSALGES